MNQMDEGEIIDIDIDNLLYGGNNRSYISIDLSYLNDIDFEETNKIIGGGLFNWCKKYPIIEDEQQVSNMMEKLFPSSLVNGTAYKIIISLSEQVSSLSPKTTTGYLTEKIVQASSATGAAVATYGAGGDMAVNSVFTIKDGLIFAAKLIKMINDLSKTLLEKKQDRTSVVSKDAIKFITNLISIDFKGSINGVECWVNDIMKYFKNTQARVFICEILQQLYPELTNFIANLMGTMIPNVGVVVKESILYIMKKNIGKNIMLNSVIKNLKGQYKKIPKSFRKMLENPELLEKNMLDTYKSFQNEIYKLFPDVKRQHDDTVQSGGLFIPGRSLITKTAKKATKFVGSVTGLDRVIIDQLVSIDKFMISFVGNIKLITFMLHKMLAMTFAILFVLKSCHV